MTLFEILRRPVWQAVAAALACHACAFAVHAQAPTQAPRAAPRVAPTVAVAPGEFDLGVVAPGSTTPARFLLVNRGSQPVTVLDAKPNCKCTAISDVKGRTIPPGGTLELSASLAAPLAPGTKEAVVFLTFEGSAPVQAKIKGEVRLAILADPPFVDALDKSAIGPSARGSVRVRSADGKPFSILSSGGRAPAFVGFDPKTSPPQAEYVLAWDLGGVPCERMPLWWHVFTDRPDCRVIPLRVRDECTGSKHDMARYARFWMVKEQIALPPATAPGRPVEVDVELEHYNPPKRGAVERPDWGAVKAVRSLSPDVEVRLVSVTPMPGDAAKVRVAIVPKRAGAIEGELEIETATGKGNVPFALYADGA